MIQLYCMFFFFFNDTATTEIYTLSLHDALPISGRRARRGAGSTLLRAGGLPQRDWRARGSGNRPARLAEWRSEEHTSELQSHSDLVCRLLLEKKKKHELNPATARNRGECRH